MAEKKMIDINVPTTPDAIDEDEGGNGSSESGGGTGNNTDGGNGSGGTGGGGRQPRMTHHRVSEGGNVGSGTASDEAPGMWRDDERRKREELEQMHVELYAAAAMLDDELRDLAGALVKNPKSLTEAEIQRLVEAGIADERTVRERCHGDHDREKEELSQLLRRIRKATGAQEPEPSADEDEGIIILEKDDEEDGKDDFEPDF